MDYKEAIEFIKNEINYNYNGQNEELQNRLYLFNCRMEDIISLLQRGEKYQQILIKIGEIADDVHYHNDAEYNCEKISELIKEAKQDEADNK